MVATVILGRPEFADALQLPVKKGTWADSDVDLRSLDTLAWHLRIAVVPASGACMRWLHMYILHIYFYLWRQRKRNRFRLGASFTRSLYRIERELLLLLPGLNIFRRPKWRILSASASWRLGAPPNFSDFILILSPSYVIMSACQVL